MLRNLTAFFSITLLLLGCSDPVDKVANQVPEHRLRPQITVVNYWAEWCKPCIKEIPEFNTFAKENPNVAVIGINFDDLEGEELTLAMEKFDMQFTAWPIKAMDDLGIQRPNVLPTTLVFNQQSELVETLVGPQSAESLKAVIEKL